MKPNRTLRSEVAALAVVIGVAGAWASAAHLQKGAAPPAALQLAQEDFANPIGEEDGPIGGPMVGGDDVGSGPIGGPMVYGDDVGSGPIGGPMISGEPVGSAPIGGPMLGGEPVGTGDDDAPIGGEPLY